MKAFWKRWAVLAIYIPTCLAFSVSAFAQQPDSGQSLGDVARKLRKDTTNEVKMTDADTKKLFESVDRIFAFAADDTGMPKHAAVKRRLVSKADVEKYAAAQMAKEDFNKSFAQEELSLKKFGFLPRDFNLQEFLVKSTGQQIAAYYDDQTKTISMLNWVPPDHQEPILAHELTHALQDQNYDLAKWLKPTSKPAGNQANSNATVDGDSQIARKAVVEGQAMVVYVDYMLRPVGRTLEDTPGLIYQMEEPAVKAVIDSQMMHDAPMILREMGGFPYQEGLIFEGELLHKGGKKMAFAGAFVRPPRNSHEVLQPEAYINGDKLPAVRIPDMQTALNHAYDVCDSGGIGELDVRALLKQYGERKIADELSAEWQGGSYVTFRKKDKVVADISPSTADVALLYVSRWKTPQAAEWFASFYARTVSQRYRTATVQPVPACSGDNCPASISQISTEEGAVIVEHWKDNSVIVSESFDPETAARLRVALRDNASAIHAEFLPQEEIGLRLFEIRAFQNFAEQLGDQIAEELSH
ncbi:MAG: hypothetical protein WAL52_22300 [Candidatus Sulfotelmatobacter sp.]